MTKQELERAAKAELARRRQRAETEALHIRGELYAAIPELAVLDGKQTEAGAKAARHAIAGERQKADACLAQVHDITTRREMLLRQHGYSLADLQPTYTCPACKDSGRLPDGKLCECFRETVNSLRQSEINESGPLRLCRFENFSLDMYPESMKDVMRSPRETMAGVLRFCKDYAADFGPRSSSLYMFGLAGLGKTHLALSIASEVLDKGYNVIYVSAQNAFAEISANHYGGDDSLFRSMLEADLLIVDDLGTEFLDSYVRSCLYELINTRMHARATIYTTNICSQNLLEQRYTEKISSRLLGECEPLLFMGEDIRLQKRFKRGT